jgi:peptide methionine sulfoxide reductase MsrA
VQITFHPSIVTLQGHPRGFPGDIRADDAEQAGKDVGTQYRSRFSITRPSRKQPPRLANFRKHFRAAKKQQKRDPAILAAAFV